MVQPPKPGGRQYADLRQQRFPGDEVNPPPTTRVSKLAHWGKFLFVSQYFQRVRKFYFEKLQIFDTFELVMV